MINIKLLTGRKTWSWIWKITGTLIVLVIFACSITINSVTQPTTIAGGTTLASTINATIAQVNATQTSALVIGILVPTQWNAANNTTVTFTSSATSGTQAMNLIPIGTPAPTGGGLSWQTDMLNTIGTAGNRINEYEWICFESPSQYTVNNGDNITVTINVSIKVSPTNMLFNMAYVVCESTDGLNSTANNQSSSTYYGTFFPPSLRVTGAGTLLDFIDPQLSVITPGFATDNDIITIPFNSTAISNPLTNASQVFLCATGYTTTGDSIKVCQQTSSSQLQSLGGGNFQKSIWPRGLFGLSASQSLDSIEYIFTDATGATKVGFNGTTTPFSYTFGCQ
jgi:Domain of unknown function (DUF4961)